MRATQLFERAVAIRPHGVATVFGHRTRTWKELGERVPRLAGGLQSLGIDNGDRVAALAMNSDRYAELFYAVPWAGAVFAPLNMRWSVAENHYALTDSQASVLLVDENFIDQAFELKQQLDTIKHLVYMGEGAVPEGMMCYESLIAENSPVDDAFRCNDDLYIIFYTAGTTSHPKGVAMSHRAIVFGAVIYLSMLPSADNIRHLYVPGFFHFAAGSPMWYVTLAGGTHVILPKFDPEVAMAAIQEHQVTNTVLVPTMVNMLMNHPEFEDYDLSSLKTCIYGGSPMPEALITRTMEKLPSWNFYQIYGMTETGGFATMLRWNDHLHQDEKAGRLRSAGQPAPAVEVRTVRPDGTRAATGELGEVVVRSDILMTEYLNNPEGSADVLKNGWMHSGDAGYFDEDGFLYIADRVKDMIVTGGENVYSIEVERALFTHPAVMEAAVIGIPSEEWGESVHAVVVPRQGHSVSEAEIIEHCRTLIGGYKVPKSVEFQAEALPVTAVGKVRKNVLREKYWAEQKTKI
ncbi:MAG: long-chain fatty acid--CoA ligase [Porticoccaceae bacterium]|nr:long-chain fatty acid--CoA ligase [Pseudomonadales bacterium]MCP5171427.1 long-chain fatty acid--CoA ligase [Pseudomonadales bacterium]